MSLQTRLEKLGVAPVTAELLVAQVCESWYTHYVEADGSGNFFVPMPLSQINSFAGKAPVLRGTNVPAICLDSSGNVTRALCVSA